MLFWVLAALAVVVALAIVWGSTYWFAAGFSSEVRAVVDTLKTSPARKCRARGRIEHMFLDEGRASSPTDLRPSPATTPYHKSAKCFYSRQRPEPQSSARAG
jgi:hypothetical protein